MYVIFVHMNVRPNDEVRSAALTKQNHIKYWIDTARRDWIAVERMLESKTYVHALFFMHLVLEKLLKAHWVKDNEGNHPPRTHNLVRLSTQINFKLTEREKKLLDSMNDFQLEGRYPDYANRLIKVYRQKKTCNIFASVNSVRKCLLKGLQ